MKHLVIFVLSLFFCLACATKQVDDRPPIQYLTHKVKYQGETLGIISGWYTGKSANWKLIESENPGLDVTRMKIGDEILIPETLLRRSDSFSQSYIKKLTQPVDTASPVVAVVAPVMVDIKTEEVIAESKQVVGQEDNTKLEVEDGDVSVVAEEPKVTETPTTQVAAFASPDEIAAKSLEAANLQIEEVVEAVEKK